MNHNIFIDGLPYLGETDETEQADYGGGGWHVANHYTRNVLGIGKKHDQPKVIVGYTCLKSEIDRIITRLRDGSIVAHEIKIVKIKDG